MRITRTSMISGETNTMELPVTEEQMEKYHQGELLQNAFPQLTPGQREFIKTGITEKEWDDMFGVEKDHIGDTNEMIGAKEQLDAWVNENYPDTDILVADGFDEAFIGVANQFNRVMAVYDRQKCIEILMRDMSEEEAHEYFEFNVVGAYVGENTPAFIEFFKPDETVQ